MLWIYHWLSYSNLRLVSLALLALWSLLALVGLYALKSAGPSLDLLMSKLRLRQLRGSTPNSENGSLSSFPLQDLYPNRFHLVNSFRLNMAAAVILILALVSIWAEMIEKPVYTYYDVRFVQKITPYSWWMEKADGGFRADFCNDYDVPSLNPQPGEILKKFRYRDMGGCLSIRDADLGFWFYRDRGTRWTVETDPALNFVTALKEAHAHE